MTKNDLTIESREGHSSQQIEQYGLVTTYHTPIAHAESRSSVPEEDTDFTSTLTGEQENPPVETEVMGTARLSLNDTSDALSYRVTVSGLDFGPLLGEAPQTPETDDDVLFAHIHEANRGENGPVVLDIISPDAKDDDLSVTTNSDGMVTLSGIWDADDSQPFINFADEFQAAAPGEDVEYYFNVHSMGNPDGEIRGQIMVPDEVDFTSELTGDQENPPVETDAMGIATLSLNNAGDALGYSITVSGLDFGPLLGQASQTPETDDDVLFAHIHEANRGENGPVVLDIISATAQDDDLAVTTNSDGMVTLSGIWDADDPQPFSDFVEEFQTAAPGEDVEYYFNVHSMGNPDGEIRGQIMAAEAEESFQPTIRFAAAGGDSLEVDTQEIVFGGDGDDFLDASNGGGNNRIFGRDGNDTLIGGLTDRLSGDHGDDVLFAGSGSTLIGGEGSDQFWVAYGALPSAVNTIQDFELGMDVIGLAGLSNASEFDDLELVQLGSDTQIQITDQPVAIAVLAGVQSTTLDSSSFAFA